MMIHLMRYFYSTNVIIQDEAHPLDYENYNHKNHVLVIKKPFLEISNIEYFSLIDLINKGWRIVWMLRDGKDVVSSITGNKYHVDADRWAFANRKILPYCLDDQVLIIRYENLVNNSLSVMDTVKKFIGQDYQENYVNWFDQVNPEDPMNSGIIPQPIHTDSIGNYKNHPERVTRAMESINFRKLLTLFGYEKCDTHPGTRIESSGAEINGM